MDLDKVLHCKDCLKEYQIQLLMNKSETFNNGNVDCQNPKQGMGVTNLTGKCRGQNALKD